MYNINDHHLLKCIQMYTNTRANGPGMLHSVLHYMCNRHTIMYTYYQYYLYTNNRDWHPLYIVKPTHIVLSVHSCYK